MKQTIALFRNVELNFDTIVQVEGDPDNFWGDSSEKYVRLSQNVEVEFQLLEDEQVKAGILKGLDLQEQKARAEFQRTLDDIEDQRARLLALPGV